MTVRLIVALFAVGCVAHLATAVAAPPPEFEIQLETVLKHDDGKFLWFHPRPVAIPKFGNGDQPRVVLTLQKHLQKSDYYSGLSLLETDDLGKSWTGPDPRPELDWVPDSGDVDIAVVDVTPRLACIDGEVDRCRCASSLQQAGGTTRRYRPLASDRIRGARSKTADVDEVEAAPTSGRQAI